MLLSQNIPVRVLDNLSSGNRGNLTYKHSLLEFIEGDITDSDMANQAMFGVSHCLNLAGQVSVVASLENSEFSTMQNIMGFINVLVTAQRNKVEKTVYATSSATYGEPSESPCRKTLQKSAFALWLGEASQRRVNRYLPEGL
ncbi:MAG: UDP-glucose 4-epimerase [Gammaproteobacteria bacterium]